MILTKMQQRVLRKIRHATCVQVHIRLQMLKVAGLSEMISPSVSSFFSTTRNALALHKAWQPRHSNF